MYFAIILQKRLCFLLLSAKKIVCQFRYSVFFMHKNRFALLSSCCIMLPEFQADVLTRHVDFLRYRTNNCKKCGLKGGQAVFLPQMYVWFFFIYRTILILFKRTATFKSNILSCIILNTILRLL